jgi:two-component system sensor histidine kinase VicK
MEDLQRLQNELVESRQREQALQLRVDELTDFLENASVPLHWVNGSGIIIWANKAELELLGYSSEEYIGKHISNFHSDPKTIEDILVRLVRKETLKNYKSYLKARNGTLIPVIINSNVRWEGNRFVHTRCFTRDISDLKKMEQEKVSLINDLHEQNKALKADLAKLRKQLKSNNLLEK